MQDDSLGWMEHALDKVHNNDKEGNVHVHVHVHVVVHVVVHVGCPMSALLHVAIPNTRMHVYVTHVCDASCVVMSCDVASC